MPEPLRTRHLLVDDRARPAGPDAQGVPGHDAQGRAPHVPPHPQAAADHQHPADHDRGSDGGGDPARPAGPQHHQDGRSDHGRSHARPGPRQQHGDVAEHHDRVPHETGRRRREARRPGPGDGQEQDEGCGEHVRVAEGPGHADHRVRVAAQLAPGGQACAAEAGGHVVRPLVQRREPGDRARHEGRSGDEGPRRRVPPHQAHREVAGHDAGEQRPPYRPSLTAGDHGRGRRRDQEHDRQVEPGRPLPRRRGCDEARGEPHQEDQPVGGEDPDHRRVGQDADHRVEHHDQEGQPHHRRRQDLAPSSEVPPGGRRGDAGAPGGGRRDGGGRHTTGVSHRGDGAGTTT